MRDRCWRAPEAGPDERPRRKLLKRVRHAVSEHSLHMQGRAIDIRLRGYNLAALRDLALAAKRGGVGYYPRSNFIHIDTGRVRRWQEE
jgi:uncharacterized protein YcbK (DUF882 family)